MVLWSPAQQTTPLRTYTSSKRNGRWGCEATQRSIGREITPANASDNKTSATAIMELSSLARPPCSSSSAPTAQTPNGPTATVLHSISGGLLIEGRLYAPTVSFACRKVGGHTMNFPNGGGWIPQLLGELGLKELRGNPPLILGGKGESAQAKIRNFGEGGKAPEQK